MYIYVHTTNLDQLEFFFWKGVEGYIFPVLSHISPPSPRPPEPNIWDFFNLFLLHILPRSAHRSKKYLLTPNTTKPCSRSIDF